MRVLFLLLIFVQEIGAPAMHRIQLDMLFLLNTVGFMLALSKKYTFSENIVNLYAIIWLISPEALPQLTFPINEFPHPESRPCCVVQVHSQTPARCQQQSGSAQIFSNHQSASNLSRKRATWAGRLAANWENPKQQTSVPWKSNQSLHLKPIINDLT